MSEKPEFVGFRSIKRLSRDVVVTEKLDGCNGLVHVSDDGSVVTAGTRNRWVEPGEDNFGFAAWVHANAEELKTLGPGYHFGEWWGAGIQRKYGLKEKRWSLFNVSKWGESRPACCGVVPVLYQGPFDTAVIDGVLRALEINGSSAAPGFMKPEGIVIYHTHSGTLFKKTLGDDGHKGLRRGSDADKV